jgi:multisubunit Na+/H+ antiporter MnhB subunit
MEMDAQVRRAMASVISGLALLLFALVLAVISLLPNGGLTALLAFGVSVFGLIFMLSGANELRAPRMTI